MDDNKPLLRDPDVSPIGEVLENTLLGSYPAFTELMYAITAPGMDMTPSWNYYKDGNAWLCKVIAGKKTVFWLSAWNGYFQVSFFFTEKTRDGVMQLNIGESIKNDFTAAKPMGKLIPVIIKVHDITQLPDVLEIARYKKLLK